MDAQDLGYRFPHLSLNIHDMSQVVACQLGIMVSNNGMSKK
ncbi:hypothetical protein [Streptococcus sp. DD04]|nr:hypothetical protein [Streptococcus sp. DD04]KXT66361.1 hypothetical protein STRDD04_00591 [Streptococcus sp. DD04]